MSEYMIDICEDVIINGDKQNLRMRAKKEGLMPILFLHGGPGVCDRHWLLKNQSQLAEKYTMVCWDQRGSGKSYSKHIKEQKLCLDTYVNDAKAVIDYIKKRFNASKVIIAGHSWGTVIGTKLAYLYPEDIVAYIGQGQFVNGAKNELLSYQFCLDEAKRLGDKTAIKKLEGNGPENGVYPTNKAMMTQRNYLSKFGGGNYKDRSGLFKSLLIPLIKTKEYSLSDISKYANGAMYLSKVLWNDVVALKYDEEIKKLDVPVIITQGRHDYNTPSVIAKKWFDELQSPNKQWIWFEESAHSPINEEPEKWGKAIMTALANIGL